MSSQDKPEEIVIDVSQAEYEADRAAGLEDDEGLQPGRHAFKRGGFLSRHYNGLGQNGAAQPATARYETQMNDALRAVMEHDNAAVPQP